jgi:site-specific DNA-adenine methylase
VAMGDRISTGIFGGRRSVKPAFAYYGGKARIASRILPYIQAIPHTVYVEPFAGSATLLFAKPKPIVSNSDHYLNEVESLCL